MFCVSSSQCHGSVCGLWLWHFLVILTYFMVEGHLVMIHTPYHNSNLIWRTVSRRVDEVIPSDHPRRVASRVIQWYGLIHETWYCTPDQVTIMIISLLYAFFLTFFLILKPGLVFNPENCGNVCHNVTFLDVTSACVPSLVPCLQFTLRNVSAKAGNRR